MHAWCTAYWVKQKAKGKRLLRFGALINIDLTAQLIPTHKALVNPSSERFSIPAASSLTSYGINSKDQSSEGNRQHQQATAHNVTRQVPETQNTTRPCSFFLIIIILSLSLVYIKHCKHVITYYIYIDVCLYTISNAQL